MGFFLQLGGALLGFSGQLEQGKAEANAATYNAQVARNNAAYASQAGRAQSEAESLKRAQVEGQVKAGQAAGGVDVNSGSNVRVQQGAREATQLDIQTIENNALLKAYGYQQESELKTEEAKQATEGADIGAWGGLLSNVGSLIGSGGDIAKQWSNQDMAGTIAAAG